MTSRTRRDATGACLECGAPVPASDDHCAACDAVKLQLTVSEELPRTGGGTAVPRWPGVEPDDRYEILDRLGAGGSGTVYLAFDRLLRRQVAYKVLHESVAEDAAQIERFISECQATSQLQHPSIVPVYDMGIRLKDNRVYYTMKAIRGETLKTLLAAEGDRRAAAMTRYRLVQLFHQICLTIGYTHSRKVLHRDLKPQNVMVGEFGEVYVMDFGLVKVLGNQVSTLRSAAGGTTDEVTIQGTLAYMAPEQVASPEAVDEATDQFALGAILYEILTRRPPYVGTLQEMWRAAINARFPAPRDIDLSVPAALEQICLRAMSLEKGDRFSGATELAERIQEYLDGEKELARRSQVAAELLQESLEQLRTYEELEGEVAAIGRELADASREIPEPGVEERDRVEMLGERRERMTRERDRAFAETIRKLVRTIDVAPDHRRAKEAIADLCFRKMVDLEAQGRWGEMASYQALVESYHEGKYAAELRGDGTITLSSQPPGAHVYLATFVARGPRLVAENERYLGRTPATADPVSMGSYLATLRRSGYPDVLLPVNVPRNERYAAVVRLLGADEIAAGFVYVAAGPFLRAGTIIPEPRAAERVELDGFCIGRNPVTMAEYLQFINDLGEREGWEAAQRRVPRVEASAGHYFVRTGDGFTVPEIDPDGDRWDERFPVFGVTCDDAEAYAAWRAARDGFPFRLPSSDEWEKAARGADGRAYPWGRQWREGLCRSLTRSSAQLPEPVGRASDASPYGILGMAGNVEDWTSTVRPGAEHLRVVRGGNFAESESMALVGVLKYMRPATVSSGVGFRLAYTPASLAGPGTT